MEIKPVPKIIEDIGKMVQEEKYEEACSFGLENIDLLLKIFLKNTFFNFSKREKSSENIL